MPDDVRASVVVVTHNSEADIVPCLESVLATLGPRDEVLVYDSGSTDRSVALARSLGVRTIAGDNAGYGGANNRGAGLTRGRWLVFLNPDTVVETGWLDALLAGMGSGPALGTPTILLAEDPSRVDACGNTVHLSGITVCRAHGRPAPPAGAATRILAVSGAAFAIDRLSFERLGGFDEGYFMYLEDTDLSLRAALAGIPCWHVPTSRVRHRHVVSFGPRKLYWLERNRYRMLLTTFEWNTLVRLLPALAVVELLTWAYALMGGRRSLGAKAAAWGWYVRNPWRLLAARRRTQSKRAVDDTTLLARCAWRLHFDELIASRWIGCVADVVAAALLWPASLPVRRPT